MKSREYYNFVITKEQIREKVFDQISIDDSQKEDGLDTLTALLDQRLKRIIQLTVLRNFEI